MLEPNRELQIDQEWQETVFRNRLHILFHGLNSLADETFPCTRRAGVESKETLQWLAISNIYPRKDGAARSGKLASSRVASPLQIE